MESAEQLKNEEIVRRQTVRRSYILKAKDGEFR